MVNPRTLLPIAFLALTLTASCQMLQSSATVDIPTAETPQDGPKAASL